MVIDQETYKLPETNYYSTEFKKRQIVLGNSFSESHKHIKGWLNRMGGEYKKTSMFTIDRKGNTFQHFTPDNYSDFTNNKSVDKKIISITIENQGWLQKDLLKDTYFDWVGNIYKRKVKVIEKRWRGFNYWDPYTAKQLKSCVELINYLCEEYNIPKKCVGHNTYIDGVEFFEGIVYKSNYYKESTDLSPAWDYKKMKDKIEKMKNRLISEELKRFSEIINYDPAHILNEAEGEITNDIIEKLEPSLPLSNITSDLEPIILLQKTLVDLGNLNKNYGINGDGVDGDFGGDTQDALEKTISSKSLTENNIDNFKGVLEENEDKVKDTISEYDTFLEKFIEQAGVSLEYLEICNKKTKFEDLKFIPKVNKCHLNVDIAKTLNELFPDESTITKSAILSVMMKEQGKGKYICAPNNNYAGVQTDSGRWGEKAKLFNDQFCAKDKERVRAFASFNSLEDGLEFIKQAFVDKGWFITLLKDVDDESVDLEETELEKISKKNAEIWQTKWNLSLNDDDWKRFKKYGYNPNLLDKPFSDSRGIYTKKVSDFTEEEKTLHNNNDKNYRSPEDIDKSLNSVGKYYKDAYEIFKDLKPNTEVEDNVGTNGKNRNMDIQTRSTKY